MIHHGLRLLVALLTFAAGTTAAWLFNSGTPKRAECRGAVSHAVLVEAAPPLAEAPRRECRLSETRTTRTLITGGIINGKAISKPQPAYPPAAKAARVSGTVTVQVEVDEDGNVAKAEAIVGPNLLREAAEDAARAARFSPTKLSGQPVRVSGVITYNFVLD